MSRISVSVLVPAYNAAKYLRETLDSILGQTYPAAEVIVVDDGSTDATAQIVASYCDAVVYRRQENGGVAKARNTGARLAKSRFLAFCDQDDLWRKDKLAVQMQLHEEEPALRYSFTNFSIVRDGTWSEQTKFDDAPEGFFGPSAEERPDVFAYRDSLYDKLLRFQPFFPSTMVIERDFFWELGGTIEELGRLPPDDMEFILRCMQQPPVGIVRTPVVGIRKHASNYSGNNLKTVLGEIEIFRFVLAHHRINDATRSLIEEQIELRRVEASYDAFREGKLELYKELLAGVDGKLIDSKAKIKLLIAGLPGPLASLARRTFLKA